MKTVEIYTDGACSGNPGVGGWGAILLYGGKVKEISGVDDTTTNNRMELMAAIEGLKALKERCNVKLYSDSAYLVNAFNLDWISGWIAKNFMKGGKPQPNIDLWQMIIELTGKHTVEFIKVKGHADNEYNNRVDRLARGEVDKRLIELGE